VAEYGGMKKISSEKSTAALSEPAYLVLAALAEGPTHGYELITRARELSAGRVTLPVATLYGTLDRLTGRDHIELVSEEVVDGRARRTYALTNDGQGLLSEETARMAQLVTAVRSIKPSTAVARSFRVKSVESVGSAVTA
jgi:PadR family transcriptional regulator, regulatory protein PadR